MKLETRVEDIEEDDLRRMYEVEGMTQVEIGRVYGVSNITVGRRMNEFKIETGYQHYYINEDFFKEWNKESSWIYMWMIGDGSISDNSCLRFNLVRKDKEVLYKFKKVMESEHPVTDMNNYHKETGKTSELSCLNIGSIEMVKDLRKLCYEDIPEWYRSDGIRGFFEAEGCVSLRRCGYYEYINTIFSQKDPAILKWIWDVLEEKEVVKRGGLHQENRYGTWRLQFAEDDSVSLYHYLYDNCGDLYLPRKKSRFEELMARRGYL